MFEVALNFGNMWDPMLARFVMMTLQKEGEVGNQNEERLHEYQ